MMDGGMVAAAARRASSADVLHMVAMARPAYRRFAVDWGLVAAWLSAHVERPEMFGCVTRDAASIAMAQDWFYRPGVPEVTMLFLAGSPWGMVRCARATLDWAKRQGAETMKIDAETGADLLPLVRRLGLPFLKSEGFSVRVRHGA